MKLSLRETMLYKNLCLSETLQLLCELGGHIAVLPDKYFFYIIVI